MTKWTKIPPVLSSHDDVHDIDSKNLYLEPDVFIVTARTREAAGVESLSRREDKEEKIKGN